MKAQVKRLGLRKEYVGASRALGIRSRGIETDKVSRNRLEIFKRQRSLPLHLFLSFLFQTDCFFIAAVDRVVQLDIFYTEIVGSFDSDRQFFNGADVGVWRAGLTIFTEGGVSVFASMK